MVPNKNSKQVKKQFPYLLVAFTVLMPVVGFAIYTDYAHPLVCTQSTKVKSILSIHHRSAMILLENGQTHEVNQATLQPGSDYCLKYERK